MNDTPSIAEALSAPFPANEVRWKPQAVSKDGKRALAICYIDARAVLDRLDAVCGIDGWQDRYEQLPNGSVVCRLRCRIGERWIVKSDVGSPSEQPDEGDRHKAAFSDALKRAAVKYGIGRYLYRLPCQWVDWNAEKRQFVRVPTLPAFALPAAKANPATAPSSAPVSNGKPKPANPPRHVPSECPF
jgi:hypothetical protein